MHLKSLLELDRFTSIGVLYLLKDQGTLSIFKNIRDELLLMIIKIIFVMPIVEMSFTGSFDMMPKGIGTHGYRLTTFFFILRIGMWMPPFVFFFFLPLSFSPFFFFSSSGLHIARGGSMMSLLPPALPWEKEGRNSYPGLNSYSATC